MISIAHTFRAARIPCDMPTISVFVGISGKYSGNPGRCAVVLFHVVSPRIRDEKQG